MAVVEPQIKQGMSVCNDALRFEREANGDVSVIGAGTSQGEDFPTAVHTIDEATWASLICSVSDRGEADYRWYEARAFHTKSRILPWLDVVGDPIRHLLDKVIDGAWFMPRTVGRRFRSEVLDGRAVAGA